MELASCAEHERLGEPESREEEVAPPQLLVPDPWSKPCFLQPVMKEETLRDTKRNWPNRL